MDMKRAIGKKVTAQLGCKIGWSKDYIGPFLFLKQLFLMRDAGTISRLNPDRYTVIDCKSQNPPTPLFFAHPVLYVNEDVSSVVGLVIQ